MATFKYHQQSRDAAHVRAFASGRGHVPERKSKRRMRIDALLPGQKYVISARGITGFMTRLHMYGAKRFTSKLLPFGKALITRVE